RRHVITRLASEGPTAGGVPPPAVSARCCRRPGVNRGWLTLPRASVPHLGRQSSNAAGRGYRHIAVGLGHPPATVRRWLRRCRGASHLLDGTLDNDLGVVGRDDDLAGGGWFVGAAIVTTSRP